jgi:hypothetical protein
MCLVAILCELRLRLLPESIRFILRVSLFLVNVHYQLPDQSI